MHPPPLGVGRQEASDRMKKGPTMPATCGQAVSGISFYHRPAGGSTACNGIVGSSDMPWAERFVSLLVLSQNGAQATHGPQLT
jgi:hypothetical protein